MKCKSKWCILVLMLAFTIFSVLNSSFFISAQQDLPLTNLRPGWDAYPLYEITHPPGANCIGENGDLYYVDNLNHKFMKMDEFGAHTELLSTGNLSFTDLEYQPNNNRILGVTENGFYAISPTQITLLKTYTYFQPLSELAVNPVDDSFYCGSLFENTDIFLFDANGNNLSTIVSDVKGCSQIVLNTNQSLLYYTHIYNGTITQLNLTSSATKTMRTGIGLPGTQEVIGIGVDDNDTLYSMTADGNERGLYKYYFNGTYEIVMNSKGGMGGLTWFPNLKSFVVAVSFGGCFVKYDPSKTEAEYLTPVVNSFSLIETRDGKILYGVDEFIYLINLSEPIGPTGQHEPTVFATTPDEAALNSILVDVDDGMYIALANDSVSIFHMSDTGGMVAWFVNEIKEGTKSVVYDEKNHDFVIVTVDMIQNSSNIWRIPVEDPMSYSKIVTFNQTTKTRGVVDDQGNIYVYEANNNSLFKIPEGAFESELLTTNFVNFTDIYGPNVIVEPTLAYCSIENGIMIGRNDDLHIFLLDENERFVFAINNRGIDNAAIFQNHNQEMLCTQSTLIIKMVYGEPPPPPPPDKIGISPVFFVVSLVGITFIVVLSVKNRRKSN